MVPPAPRVDIGHDADFAAPGEGLVTKSLDLGARRLFDLFGEYPGFVVLSLILITA